MGLSDARILKEAFGQTLFCPYAIAVGSNEAIYRVYVGDVGRLAIPCVGFPLLNSGASLAPPAFPQ